MDYEIMHAAIKILDKRSKQMDGELYHKYGVGPAYSSNKQVHGIGPAIDAKLAREIAQYAMDCIDQEVKKLSRDNGVANIIRERSSGKIKYNHGDWRDDEQAFASDRMIHSIVEKIKNSVENKVQSRYGTTTTDLYRYGFGNNKRFDNDNVLRDISSIIHEKINEHIGIAHSAMIHTAIGIIDKREAMDELYHYGRKGMKWDEHIFAEDEETRRRRAGAQNEETGAQRAARLKKELLLRRANKAAEKEGKAPYQDPYSKPVTNTVNSEYYRKKYGGIGKGSDYVNAQITNKQKAQENAAKYGSIGKGSDYANKKIAEQAETNKKAKRDELISRGKSMLPDYKKIAENREAGEKEERNKKIQDFDKKMEDTFGVSYKVNKQQAENMVRTGKSIKNGTIVEDTVNDTKKIKELSQDAYDNSNLTMKSKEQHAHNAAREAMSNVADKVEGKGFNQKDWDKWVRGGGNAFYENVENKELQYRLGTMRTSFANALRNPELDYANSKDVVIPGIKDVENNIKNSDKMAFVPQSVKKDIHLGATDIVDLANEMSKYGFDKNMFPLHAASISGNSLALRADDMGTLHPEILKPEKGGYPDLDVIFDKNGNVVTNKQLNEFFDKCSKMENSDYKHILNDVYDKKVKDAIKR